MKGKKEEEKLRQKHFDSALPEQEHVPVAQVFAATTFVSMVFFFISNSVLPSSSFKPHLLQPCLLRGGLNGEHYSGRIDNILVIWLDNVAATEL